MQTMTKPDQTTFESVKKPSKTLSLPLLRGWIHLVTTPLAFAAALVLDPPDSTDALGVCGVPSLTLPLFGMSALYHRGRWKARTPPFCVGSTTRTFSF